MNGELGAVNGGGRGVEGGLWDRDIDWRGGGGQVERCYLLFVCTPSLNARPSSTRHLSFFSPFLPPPTVTRLIERNQLPHLLFYGPPGTGR